jgi:hypothetical protein
VEVLASAEPNSTGSALAGVAEADECWETRYELSDMGWSRGALSKEDAYVSQGLEDDWSVAEV